MSEIPRHMKVQVRKYGRTWYLIRPGLTGNSSSPYPEHGQAHAVAFRLAGSIERWVKQ